jgi:flagellar hook-basal body complex protein FliE
MAIDQVLAQIRAISAQAGVDAPRPAALGAAQPTGTAGVSEFATILKRGIDAVNHTELKASALADAFSRGAPGVSLPQVVLQMEKASVSFSALTQVRNRLVSAYQDIMNMQM